jgi:hypothetical protein
MSARLRAGSLCSGVRDCLYEHLPFFVFFQVFATRCSISSADGLVMPWQIFPINPFLWEQLPNHGKTGHT